MTAPARLPASEIKRLLRVRDAAEIMGVAESTVRRLIKGQTDG